jgi:hypothetical protein
MSSSTPPSEDGSTDRGQLMPDRGVAYLRAAAGSDEAVSRGYYIAVGIVAVGVVGTLGVGLRPLYRKAFAARAAQEAAVRAAAADERRAMNADQVAVLMARLNTLQARHRARHPMLYGDAEPGAASSSSSTGASAAATDGASGAKPAGSGATAAAAVAITMSTTAACMQEEEEDENQAKEDQQGHAGMALDASGTNSNWLGSR